MVPTAMMQRYTEFTFAYWKLVGQVHQHYTYESAPRGLKVRETLGHTFRLSDPRNRLLYLKQREFSLPYMVAECLWYMKGDNRTDWIGNYSGFWRNISDDGTTANSAYGARIFRQHPYQAYSGFDMEDDMGGSSIVPARVVPQGWSQWDYVKEELRRDPDSRRAVIHIRMPQDSVLAVKDMPCTLTLQFLIRDRKLHLCAGMRSSDLIFGIAYDIPAFTVMQEMLAHDLGVGLGEYMHTSNSLHIYERHFEMCDRILGDLPKNAAKPMPAMPAERPIDEMWHLERRIRACDTARDVGLTADHADKSLDPYWSDWVRILAAQRAGKLGHTDLRNDLIRTTHFDGYHFFGQ